METIKYKIREMTKDDVSFVIRSILENFRNNAKFFSSIDKDSYYRNHNAKLVKALRASDCLLIVDVKDPDIIIGFVVYKHNQSSLWLHYIYIRNDFRKIGLAKKLLEIVSAEPKEVCVLSHKTDKFNPAALRKYGFSKIVHSPYILDSVNDD